MKINVILEYNTNIWLKKGIMQNIVPKFNKKLTTIMFLKSPLD